MGLYIVFASILILVLLVVDAIAYEYFILHSTNKEGERFWSKHPEVFGWTMVTPFSSLYLLYRYIKFRTEDK